MSRKHLKKKGSSQDQQSMSASHRGPCKTFFLHHHQFKPPPADANSPTHTPPPILILITPKHLNPNCSRGRPGMLRTYLPVATLWECINNGRRMRRARAPLVLSAVDRGGQRTHKRNLPARDDRLIYAPGLCLKLPTHTPLLTKAARDVRSPLWQECVV